MIWWSWTGSNRRPSECHPDALPTELQPHNQSDLIISPTFLMSSPTPEIAPPIVPQLARTIVRIMNTYFILHDKNDVSVNQEIFK